MLTNLFTLITIIIFLPAILKLISIIRVLIQSILESKNSFSLAEALNRLTFKEFRIWCIDYLLSLGYHDIMFTTESEADMICKKEDNIYLVKCLQTGKNLNINDVQLLIGTMISEEIYKGIIITTSKATSLIYEYIEKIPKYYDIEIISNEDLKSEYDDYNRVIN